MKLYKQGMNNNKKHTLRIKQHETITLYSRTEKLILYVTFIYFGLTIYKDFLLDCLYNLSYSMTAEGN